MIKYFSKEYDYKELCRRTGNFGAFAGAQRIAYTEGKAKGVEAVEVRTGGGLRYNILLDRGMDIAFAEYKSIPLVYLSQTGIVAPQYYEADEQEWLRGFSGGLLTTCGLNQVGNPCEYKGEKHGLHGRISNSPASSVCVWEEVVDGEYVIRVKGRVIQAKSCAENLVLTREVISYAGKNRITVLDSIENRGNTIQPFMLLYHCNMGFPLLNDNAEILIPHKSISSMYEGREKQMAAYGRMGPPVQELVEDVFYFDVIPDECGFANIFVVNDTDHPQLAMQISYKTDVLTNLAVWKQCSAGDYVVGIEPCNNDVNGIAEAEKNASLQYLSPGEKRCTELRFEIFEGEMVTNNIHKFRKV